MIKRFFVSAVLVAFSFTQASATGVLGRAFGIRGGGKRTVSQRLPQSEAKLTEMFGPSILIGKVQTAPTKAKVKTKTATPSRFVTQPDD